MSEKEIKKLQKDLNAISLKNCKDIKIGDILYYVLSEQDDWKAGLRSIIRMIIRIAAVVSYEFHVKGNPKTVYLFSNSYRGRKDHYKAFKNVTALAPNSVEMICAKHKLKLMHLQYLLLPLFWNRQMKKIVPEFGVRMRFVSTLFQAYIDYITLSEAIKENQWDIHSLVVYCDVMPVDCYFVQRFNQKKKNTITLQHALFNTKSNAWAYLGSKSKYFLAENLLAVEEAEKIGYTGNMIPVGSPHYFGQKKYKKPESFQSEIIGIVMNSSMLPIEDNIGMITFIQDFCRKTSRKVILKYHPSNISEEYEKYIDWSLTTTYGKEITAEEFGEMVDVAIVSASTVFTTMLRQWVPVFLYVRKNHDPMLYPNTEEFKFTDEIDLTHKLENLNLESSIKKMSVMRDVLLGEGNFEENYKKAFEMIGIL